MAALLQCSIGKDEQRTLSADSNGFVHAVLNAYAAHHHLVIRPDDVWIAILTQLSFYVNAHAEELRAYFVAHEGTRRLIVEDVGTRHSVDFGRLARAMTREIHKNVVDSTLAEWILPDFTTTTIKDSTICSVLMMSTLKAYFEYYVSIICGIPTVTLEGTKADWERIVKRLDRLHELGDEPSAWANMLYPILRRFVSAFDGKPDTVFWKHVVYRQEEICGQDDLNGWLTAFCVWTNKGKWNAGPLPELLTIPRPAPTVVAPGPRPEFVKPTSTPTPTRRMRLAKMISAPFRARARKSEDGADQHDEAAEDTTAECDPSSQSILTIGDYTASYTLDGIPYFTIAVGSIPAGYAEVDVTVVDNGQPFPCKMIAGHLATAATAKDPGGALNTIAPAPQWFMIEKKTS
ncbi:hypothetical protein TRAPUB_9148 [Trametes pubescens]|uniref:Uncharacterized protein n=1 Tax=Trametes pubescens TaxID=154538 RepID=A0A1M2W359_TRAPU|nr:hypothetical protein TRAPUB_9148 [Trametes pubescens]